MRCAILILGLAGLALAACKEEAPVVYDFPVPTAAQAAAIVGTPYAEADLAAGREAFNLCAVCHRLSGPSGPNGPSLEGVFGARAAARTDYVYSEAMLKSGLVWDAPHLEQLIFNPRKSMPGMKMSFIGIRNDKKRRDLMAYLIAMSAPPQ